MKKLILALALVIATTFMLVNFSSAETGMKGEQGAPIVGKVIKDQKGEVLGKVENVVLTDEGCVQYVILSGQFSGAKSRLYPLPWNVFNMRGETDYFVADVTPDILIEAPSFYASSYPDFRAAGWNQNVYNFYRTRVHVNVKDRHDRDRDRDHRSSAGFSGDKNADMGNNSRDKANNRAEDVTKDNHNTTPKAESNVGKTDKKADKSSYNKDSKDRATSANKNAESFDSKSTNDRFGSSESSRHQGRTSDRESKKEFSSKSSDSNKESQSVGMPRESNPTMSGQRGMEMGNMMQRGGTGSDSGMMNRGGSGMQGPGGGQNRMGSTD
jgi:hypothetical protein